MTVREELTEVWPLFGLEVRTPRLTLRVPDDADLALLARLSDEIHPPDRMPFQVPWSIEPPEVRHPALLQYHWSRRAAFGPESWSIDMAVVVDGTIVGCQGIEAEHFTEERTVTTGSWLHRAVQGRGLGREMRSAVLHLAFAGLGAERAISSAFTDNPASQRVSEVLGYIPVGEIDEEGPGGSLRRRIEYVIDRASWSRQQRPDIEVVGLDDRLEKVFTRSLTSPNGLPTGS